MTTSTIRLNLSVKKQDQEPNVRYNSYKQLKINHRGEFLNESKSVDFILLNLQKEVKTLSHDKKKRYVKIAKTTFLTSMSVLTLVTPQLTFAAVPVSTPPPDMIMPKDIMEIGMYLIGLTAVASTVLAMFLGQLVGNYKMLRKGEKANSWATEIIKGYVQTIAMPLIIVTIALLAYLLFGNSQFFSKPF
jgi:hypothetical protein